VLSGIIGRNTLFNRLIVNLWLGGRALLDTSLDDDRFLLGRCINVLLLGHLY
jgi:hypothetical protein